MDKKIILVVVLIVAAVGLAGVGIGSYISASNMKKELANQQEKEELEKVIEDKINEKTSEEKEKADAEKKAATKKASLISADEAYNGYTTKAPNKYEIVECEITGKEKKIPSNVDQKAQGGMISCTDVKYRTYVGNDDDYYSYKVGDYVVLKTQWIDSTKFYLFNQDSD